MSETVFQFQNIWDPAGKQDARSGLRVETGDWLTEDPIVDAYKQGAASEGAETARDAVQQVARRFLDAQDGQQDANFPKMADVLDWVGKHTDDELSQINFATGLKTALGKTPAEFLERADVKAAGRRAAGRFLATSTLAEPDMARDTGQQLKLLHLVGEVAAGRAPDRSDMTLGDYLAQLFLVLPKEIKPVPRQPPKAAEAPPATGQARLKKQYLDDLGAAYDAVRGVLSDPESRLRTVDHTPFDLQQEGPEATEEVERVETIDAVVLNRAMIAALPERSRTALETVVPQLEQADPFAAVSARDGPQRARMAYTLSSAWNASHASTQQTA